MSVLESLFEEYQQLKNLVSDFEKTNEDLQSRLAAMQSNTKPALELEPLKIRISELEEQNQELIAQLTEQSKLLAEKDKEITQLKARLNEASQMASSPQAKSPISNQAKSPISNQVVPPARQHSTTEALNIIENSGLFDKSWYLQQYLDVAKSGMNPAEHYLLFGVAEMRNPSAGFNTASYLRQHPELLRSKVNPIIHYVSQSPQKF